MERKDAVKSRKMQVYKSELLQTCSPVWRIQSSLAFAGPVIPKTYVVDLSLVTNWSTLDSSECPFAFSLSSCVCLA